jgi:hypothetical protein
VNAEPPFGLLQFTVSEVENTLMVLKSQKDLGPNVVPPLILKICSSAFAFSTTGQRVSSPIDGNFWLLLTFSRIVSAMTYRIAKLFELLVYRVKYKDLRSRLTDSQHGFVKGWSPVFNLLKYFSFVSKSIKDGCHEDSIYTDFLKAFDRVSQFTFGQNV